MANWKTARQIAERYMVGEERLLAYSRRGNLPCRRLDDGMVEFDEEAVAGIFRPRAGSPAAIVLATGAPNLGVLGVSRLGESADRGEATGRRAAHRRSIRLAGTAPIAMRKAVG